MNTPLAIDVTGLTKRYGNRTVVDHVTLQVERGKIIGFLGPNGSGKTTSIRMLCGLLTPDAGEGTCLGYDLRKEADAIKKRVGYMTQKFSFWEDLTIRENLAFVAELFGMDRRKDRVDEALETLGLTSRAGQLAGALSGGWKQRLALAACILHEPDLLLLDEPTAGVDPAARRAFWEEIHKLAAEGLTVLVSTHYMDEAERCHAIIYIAYGHILMQGSVEEVIAKTGLSTWVVRGKGLMELLHEVEALPAVATAAPFGDSLHVSGPDSAKLEAALTPFFDKKGFDWERSAPSLEDAFIHAMTLLPPEERG